MEKGEGEGNGGDKLNFKYWYHIKMQSSIQRAKGMAMNKVLVWALVLAMMPAGGQAYAADNIDGLINGLFCKDEHGVHVCADFIPADGIFYYGTYPNGKLIGKGYAKGGKHDGTTRFYYESGQLEEEGNYKNDKPEGVWKRYNENGQLVTEECFM